MKQPNKFGGAQYFDFRLQLGLYILYNTHTVGCVVILSTVLSSSKMECLGSCHHHHHYHQVVIIIIIIVTRTHTPPYKQKDTAPKHNGNTSMGGTGYESES